MSEYNPGGVGDSLFVRAESADEVGLSTTITTPMLATSFKSIRDSFKRSDSISSQISIFGSSSSHASTPAYNTNGKNGELEVFETTYMLIRFFHQFFVFCIIRCLINERSR